MELDFFFISSYSGTIFFPERFSLPKRKSVITPQLSDILLADSSIFFFKPGKPAWNIPGFLSQLLCRLNIPSGKPLA